MKNLTIELTLENLKAIKLWHYLAFKDTKEEELRRADIQTITKINALTITAREQVEYQRRLDKMTNAAVSAMHRLEE